ncbi:MAG: exodeoxyribonuclease VII small subunit [Atopobiaceae bacterium]|jgi:exodeoxyribonuclease VII small subunit|nr:exodeoxyribonuclease VII small subunit [Atopobiaceae bacterium]
MNDKEYRPIEELSYKEASIELEQIVRALESGSLELEESIKTYTRGVELLKSLKARIAEAEERVKALLEDNPVTVG